MSDEQKSFPVRYMPVLERRSLSGYWHDIIDTSYEGQEKIVFSIYDDVHLTYKIVKYLNEAEGYVYEP